MSRTEQVVMELGAGFCIKEVSDHLKRSSKTIEYHWAMAKRKYGLRSYVDAAHFALSRGWVRNKYDS